MTFEWFDVIRKQGEESLAAQKKTNAILDRMVSILDDADEFWFAGYPEAKAILEATDALGTEHGSLKEVQRYKREAVKNNLWLGVQAACAAGIVTVSSEDRT